MKTIQLTLIILLSLLTTYSCKKDDDSKDSNNTTTSKPTESNEIEINYKVEASGYKNLTEVSGTVEYADKDGIKTTEISEPWETTVQVPRGHNLYFRVVGKIVQGTVVVKATAVDKANGKVVFSDQLTDTTPYGTQASFDFQLESKNLGN